MMHTYGITDRMILGDLYDLVVLEASHSVIITTIPFNFLVVVINFLNFFLEKRYSLMVNVKAIREEHHSN